MTGVPLAHHARALLQGTAQLAAAATPGSAAPLPMPPPAQTALQPPAQLPTPTPASPVYSAPPDQFQAAKYFTFIFFGLSVFVILVFGGFVVCHCYRRLRYDRQRARELEIQVAQLAGAPPAPREVIIEVPVKQGFVVTNPDGGMEVAYLPDTPRPRQDSNKPQAPAAAGGSDAGAPLQASSTGTTPESAEGRAPPRAPEQAPAVQVGSAAGLAGDVRQMPQSLSSPNSPSARTATDAAPPRAEGGDDARLDQNWRQRQAQSYHIF